jgi:hypothetical protein
MRDARDRYAARADVGVLRTPAVGQAGTDVPNNKARLVLTTPAVQPFAPAMNRASEPETRRVRLLSMCPAQAGGGDGQRADPVRGLVVGAGPDEHRAARADEQHA